MDFTQNIGPNIRSVRKEKGLSQQTLAEKCGFSNTTLSSYENNKKIPSLVTLANIARSLGVSIERLYYGDENNMFITSVPNAGRKIVNAIFFLWEKGVLYYDENAPLPFGMNVLYNENNNGGKILLFRFLQPLLRLIKSLNEFSYKKETFPDPDGYLEMLLSSVATEIDKEIESSKS